MNSIIEMLKLCGIKANVELISSIGKIKKQIGFQYFIAPLNSDFKAVSINIFNEKINRLMLELSKPLCLDEIKRMFNSNPEINYSSYDDLTYYKFYSKEENCSVRFLFRGRNEKKVNVLFNELEITSI